MTYRLSDRYGDAELEEWVHRQELIDGWIWHWFGGIGFGVIVGYMIAVWS